MASPGRAATYKKQARRRLELYHRSLESGDMELEGVAQELHPRRSSSSRVPYSLVRCRAEGLGAPEDVDGNDIAVLADGEACYTDDNLSFTSHPDQI